MAKNPYEFSYSMKQEFRRKVTMTIIYIVILFIVITSIFNFIIFPKRFASNSMNPSINSGDIFFISQFHSSDNVFLKEDNFKRGDLVLVKLYQNKQENFFTFVTDAFVRFVTFQQFSFLNKTREDCYIRRVIGFPGDEIYIENFTAYIKPSGESHFLTEFELTEKDYDIFITKNQENFDETVGMQATYKKLTLADGEFFLLADNRIMGIDSRFWGKISSDKIKGKVLLRYFPFSRLDTF